MKYLIISILVIMLLIAGCGESKSDVIVSNKVIKQVVDDKEANPNEELQKIFDSKPKNLKVVYDVQNNLNLEAMNVTPELAEAMSIKSENNYQMSMVIRGKDFKSFMNQDIMGKKQESITYLIDSSMVICGKEEGMEYQCMRMEGAFDVDEMENKLGEFGEALGVEQHPGIDFLNFTVESRGTRQIAGTTAKCFYIKEWDVENCYADGVMLYTEVESEQFHMTMEATEYSLTVDDSDFEFPAEPVDMSESRQGFLGSTS